MSGCYFLDIQVFGGHHKKPHRNGDPSLVNYHTASTMPLGKSLHLGRLALLSVTQQSDVHSESAALRWQQLEEGWRLLMMRPSCKRLEGACPAVACFAVFWCKDLDQ